MHLSVSQHRFPSSLNHTPRTLTISPYSDPPTQKSVRFQVLTPRHSELPLASMTTTFSAFPNTGNLAMMIHGNPIAPRHCSSFSIDRPTSTTSRRHSWTSSYDILTPSGMLEDMMGDSGNEHVTLKPAPASHLPRPGATFEMAYFLKNTGPPPPREIVGRGKKIVGTKKSLGMFKKRRDGIVARSSLPARKTLDNFIPSERVEQKVTLNGLYSTLNPIDLHC
jgi:hypothetical protein